MNSFFGLASDSICEILSAENRSKLGDALYRSAYLLGFDRFILSINKSDPLDILCDPDLTNIPPEEIDRYAGASSASGDPLLLPMSTSRTARLWTPETFGDMGQLEHRETLETLGISGGATIPLPAEEAFFSSMTLLASSNN